MSLRTILIHPDARLRKKCELVKNFDSKLENLTQDMLETMYDAPGIGLAAIQVGIPKRIIVMDISRGDEKKNPLFFINPEIIWKENENATYEEGCLSVPDQFAEIDRPKKCHIKFLDYFGKEQLTKAEGLLATCIQHEMDHLEGILFIDYLSKLKKSMIIKKLSKIKVNRKIF